MKKFILLLIVASISIITTQAQEFTMEFNYAEMSIGDSVIKSETVHSSLVFNYRNEDGIVKLKLFGKESILKPIKGGEGEENGIQYKKMETEHGDIIIVGLDIDHDKGFLAGKEGENLWILILSKTDNAEDASYDEPEDENKRSTYSLE